MTVSIYSPKNDEKIIFQEKERIDSLNKKAWQCESINPQEGLVLSKEAYNLSTNGEFHLEIYKKGVADSLFNQAHFNLNRGDYPLALAQSIEALSLYNDLKHNERQARILCNMGAVYLAMNEYSKAMETLIKGLSIARDLMNPIPMGEVLLNIGIAYLFVGDLEQAFNEFKKSLQIFQSSENAKNLTYAYCNLAAAYMMQGEYEIFMQYSDRALRYAEQIGSDYIKIDLLRQRGQYEITQGDVKKAHELFQESLILSQKHGYQADEVAAAIWLGEIKSQTGNCKEAVDILLEALDKGQKYQFKEGCLRAYRKLSEIYAGLNDYKKAYQNMRLYNDLDKTLAREKNELRYKSIETVYRTQAIQKEARIIQTKNEQLEKEIAERKWVEEALRQSEDKYRRLANLDALTSLNNRRFFYELATIEMRRVRRYHHPMCILMIDIDHFKKTNDRLGHLAGDQVLQWVARRLEEFLREVDIIGRFGGEEFIVLLPETDLEKTKIVAKRLCKQFEDAEFEVRNQLVKITVSIGVCAFTEDTTLDKMIDHADQALYAAKQAGRNRVFVWKNIN